MAEARKVWKQVWADSRAVVYVWDKATLKAIAKKNGKWWCPVGRPQLVPRPKGVRVY